MYNPPAKYKTPKLVTQKTPWGLVLGKLPSNTNQNTAKKGKFSSNYKANPIDFETQISLRRLAPQKGSLKIISLGGAASGLIFGILRYD